MNYIIENNIDFFSELNKELSEDSNKINTKINAKIGEENNISHTENLIIDNKDNICLLTHLPLEENYITLCCDHKFNYIPLYNEISNQKVYNSNQKDKKCLNEINNKS